MYPDERKDCELSDYRPTALGGYLVLTVSHSKILSHFCPSRLGTRSIHKAILTTNRRIRILCSMVCSFRFLFVLEKDCGKKEKETIAKSPVDGDIIVTNKPHYL